MRTALIFAIVGSIACSGLARASTQSGPPFKVVIMAPTKKIFAGAPLELKVRLTNTSNQDINASASYFRGLDASYKYEVRDSAGAPVAPIPQETARPPVGQGRIRTLSPGQSVDEVIVITSGYRLAPGTYTIQLSRPVSASPNSPVVQSNKVNITVVAPR